MKRCVVSFALPIHDKYPVHFMKMNTLKCEFPVRKFRKRLYPLINTFKRTTTLCLQIETRLRTGSNAYIKRGSELIINSRDECIDLRVIMLDMLTL